MNLKGSLARPAHWAAYLTGASLMQTRLQGGSRILMFHEVGPPAVTARSFESQLQYLKRHFHVLPLAEVVGALLRGAPLGRRGIALTFDDGLRSAARDVYPVLARLRLPATFFVCPGLIDQGRWLWNHEARERLLSLPAQSCQRLAAEVGAPGNGVEPVIAWMKTLPLARRREVEGAIRQASPAFRATTLQSARFDLMTWEEIGRLDPALVTIGSHTLTHPILTTLSPAEIEVEVAESRAQLEARLQREVDLFCYPNGSHDDRVLRAVSATYSGSVTTVGGIVREAAHPHCLPRIASTAGLPELVWRLHRPGD